MCEFTRVWASMCVNVWDLWVYMTIETFELVDATHWYAVRQQKMSLKKLPARFRFRIFTAVNWLRWSWLALACNEWAVKRSKPCKGGYQQLSSHVSYIREKISVWLKCFYHDVQKNTTVLAAFHIFHMTTERQFIFTHPIYRNVYTKSIINVSLHTNTLNFLLPTRYFLWGLHRISLRFENKNSLLDYIEYRHLVK